MDNENSHPEVILRISSLPTIAYEGVDQNRPRGRQIVLSEDVEDFWVLVKLPSNVEARNETKMTVSNQRPLCTMLEYDYRWFAVAFHD